MQPASLEKTEQIMVRVSPDEKELIESAAQERGTYPSTFTREAAIRAALRVVGK